MTGRRHIPLLLLLTVHLGACAGQLHLGREVVSGYADFQDRPRLKCPRVSDTGAYKLTWKDAGKTFALFENHRLQYQGPDRGTTVSGRPAGQYVYQVARSDPGTDERLKWGLPCLVTVAPPSLSLAFGFLGMGFTVFVVVLGVVVAGHRAHRRGELG